MSSKIKTSFRDLLTTTDRRGIRKWVYPRVPEGDWTRLRRIVSIILVGFLVVAPFLRWEGQPVFLLDFLNRKFILFSQLIWPQELHLFLLVLLVFGLGLILFTTVLGRLWCGWACPQTVFLEMVFRPLEFLLEGSGPQQKKFDQSPLGFRKIWIKSWKHGLFFMISFSIGNILLAWIIGSDELWKIITDPPLAHLEGLTYMILFSLAFYWNFSWFREQFCSIICPYARLQSALLDENTLMVTYDYVRGEREEGRAKLGARHQMEAEEESELGDCIDCRRCVDACPSAVDIRNGLQLECIQCTACVDACNLIMDRIGKDRGLIRYASQKQISDQGKFQFTRRMAAYCLILTATIALLFIKFATRPDVNLGITRARGSLFTMLPDGHCSNLYQLKLTNNTFKEQMITMKLMEPEGSIQIPSPQILVEPASRKELPFFVILQPSQLIGHKTPLTIGAFSNGQKITEFQTTFLGPLDGS